MQAHWGLISLRLVLRPLRLQDDPAVITATVLLQLQLHLHLHLYVVPLVAVIVGAHFFIFIRAGDRTVHIIAGIAGVAVGLLGIALIAGGSVEPTGGVFPQGVGTTRGRWLITEDRDEDQIHADQMRDQVPDVPVGAGSWCRPLVGSDSVDHMPDDVQRTCELLDCRWRR